MRIHRLLFFIPSLLGATPVINEIHYAPDDQTTLTEFIEIYNPDSVAINLSGWTLAGGASATIPNGTFLLSGGYLLIAENESALNNSFSLPASVTVVPMSNLLSNEGETIRLMDFSGVEVDRVAYRAEFPWPVPAAGDGPSMELLNPALDNDLGGSWASSDGSPTPGTVNSNLTSNAGPQMRQVNHSPQMPTDQQPLVVTVKATDPDGIGSLALSYQIVTPGNYISAQLPLVYGTLTSAPETAPQKNPEFENPANWTTIAMTPIPDDSERFTATIPAQEHRSLIRYRITAFDALSASQRAPALDDPSQNFAAFSYNGVPDYTAADSTHPDGDGKVYSSEMLTQLPVYQMITDPDDLQYAYAYSGTSNQSFQIAKGNRPARKVFNWECAMVYDGIVYDHVRWRLRQNNNRYAANGKRSMRFRFNRGHYFQARDEEGKKWPVKWRTMNTGKMSSFSSATNYGLREVVNSRIFRTAGIACPYFYHIHLRVIDDVDEAPTQQGGDFFGLGMAFEDIDGRLLDARNLPDGNLYKWKDGETNPLNLQKNQARYSVSDGSDFSTFRSTLNLNRTEAELAEMVDWNQWSLYHTVCEALRHYDFGTASSHRKNMAWYFQPQPDSQYGRLRLIPHDHDATWGRGYHDNIRIGIGRDYPWRAIFSQSSEVGAADDRTPLQPVYNEIYRNTVRNFRDLFWNELTIHAMIDETLASIEEFTFADRDRWTGGNVFTGRETSMPPPQNEVSSMKSIAFLDDRVDGETLVGGRAAFLDQLAQDADIPTKPTLSYTGTADFPPGELAFQASPFSDPQGAGTHAATQWRIAEYTPGRELVTNIFSTGTEWSYRDTGEDLGTAWRNEDFDNSVWSSGPSPLGYNEGDIVTTINSGPNILTRYITSYFRKDFTVNVTNLEAEYRMRIRRDDGCVIYLNGSEIRRLGMPSGEILFETTANENATEKVYDEIFIPASSFRNGVNTLAIELHQRSNSSSDTFLDVIIDEFSGASDQLATFEWNATWESATVTETSATPPAIATRTGLSYRARARYLDDSGRYSNWSDPLEFTAGFANTEAYENALVIAEFLPNPEPASQAEIDAGFSTSDFEHIRLKNISSQPLNLVNVRFTKGIDLDLSGSLAPGAEVVLAREPSAYLNRYPEASGVLGPWNGKLKNEGEQLKLSFGAGTPIRDFTYFDTPAWPSSTDGTSFALALINPSSNPNHGLVSSWRPTLAGFAPEFFTGTTGADEDQDGIPAIVEHALGTSDSIFTPQPLALNSGSISISRNLNAADVNLILAESETLEAWLQLQDSTILSSDVDINGNWTVRYGYDQSSPKKFFRLETR